MWMQKCMKLGAAFTAALLLCACSTGQRAGWLTLQEAFAPAVVVRQTPLKPDLRYLLVETGGREALMVWVGQERSSLGDASVWVSADGVVLRLLQGRLVGVAEPRRSWRLVAQTAVSTTGPVRWMETSDEQPGFRLGVVRTVERVTAAQVPAALAAWAVGAQDLRWSQEVDASTGQSFSFVGVNTSGQVQAGQRCLAPDWCWRWQAWPAKSLASSL
jgi:hypothetical protein